MSRVEPRVSILGLREQLRHGEEVAGQSRLVSRLFVSAASLEPPWRGDTQPWRESDGDVWQVTPAGPAPPPAVSETSVVGRSPFVRLPQGMAPCAQWKLQIDAAFD